jgi:hypothetical protein
MPEKMTSECKPVTGKVPGPKNHLLCAKHGHVFDIKMKMVIAKDLAAYKKHQAIADAVFKKIAGSSPAKMTPDCKPVHGKLVGPPAHIQLCSKHGHVVDTKAKVIVAKSEDEFQKNWEKVFGIRP